MEGPYYLCLDKFILKSRVYPAIEFILDDTLTAPEIRKDFNRHCVRIKYSRQCTYRQLSKYIEIKKVYPGDAPDAAHAKAEICCIDSNGRLRDILKITAPDQYGIQREYIAEGSRYTQLSRGYVDLGSTPAEFLENLVRCWPEIHPSCLVTLSVKPSDPQVLVLTYKYPGDIGNTVKFQFYNKEAAGEEHQLEVSELTDSSINGAHAVSQPIPLISGNQLCTRLEIYSGDSVYQITGSNRTNIAFRYINMGKNAAEFAANIIKFWDKVFPDCPVTIRGVDSDASSIQIYAKNIGSAANDITYRVYADSPGETLQLSGGEDKAVPVPVLENPDDVVRLIEPGVYVLYTPVNINGFHIAVSEAVKDFAFRQYIIKKIDNIYIDKTSLNEQVITVLCPESVRMISYINRINECGHLYIIRRDKDCRIEPVCLLQTVKANRISVRTFPMVPVLTEKLLVESSDYISALILHLQRDYPEIQFYNYPPDANDTKYSEFVFYRAHPEQLSPMILTTPVMSDPVYGDVIRTTCFVEFEYYTHDLLKFNKRRFDFLINRFISDHTVSYLTIPETDHRFSFSVSWNREQAAADNNYQKQLALADTQKSQLAFLFNATLTVTIYRLNNHYPVNVQTIVNQYEGPDTSTKLLAKYVYTYPPGENPHGEYKKLLDRTKNFQENQR